MLSCICKNRRDTKLIETGLKFVHGGDFEKYFDSYVGGKMYATNNLLKYVKIFKNTGIENRSSKLLLDSMWKIYEQTFKL